MTYDLRAYLKALEDGLPELERNELPRSIVVEEEYLKKGLAALPRFWPIKAGAREK